MPRGLLPQPNQFNKRAHFYEIMAGAGDTTWKVNFEGMFMGGSNFTAAPFSVDYDGNLIATDGTLKGDLTVTGTITAGSPTGSEIVLDGTSGKIEFYYNSVLKGDILADSNGNISWFSVADTYFGTTAGQVIRLINATGGVELRTAGSAISWTSGRKITDGSSKIIFDGDLMPTTDEGSSLGDGSFTWDNIYGKSIVANGTGAKFSINGNDGLGIDVYYKDHSGTDQTMTFVGGILTGDTA